MQNAEEISVRAELEDTKRRILKAHGPIWGRLAIWIGLAWAFCITWLNPPNLHTRWVIYRTEQRMRAIDKKLKSLYAESLRLNKELAKAYKESADK